MEQFGSLGLVEVILSKKIFIRQIFFLNFALFLQIKRSSVLQESVGCNFFEATEGVTVELVLGHAIPG